MLLRCADEVIVSAEPTLIAKSNVILDVKPWDDETDMKELEREVRSIQMDGLLWGACKYLCPWRCMPLVWPIIMFTGEDMSFYHIWEDVYLETKLLL